nr:Plug domain-containing protein [uncultured Halomonas sp.]
MVVGRASKWCLNNNNGGNGTTTINIRGIGSNRTLVLVNGKRWAPGLGGSVDLNNIPAAIIERIEVLKDGEIGRAHV